MLRKVRSFESKSSVCPFVRLSVTFRYRDNIGWNSLKIISRSNSLRQGAFSHWPQRGRSGATGTPPKLGWNRVQSGGHKSCSMSETVQDRTKVTITD